MAGCGAIGARRSNAFLLRATLLAIALQICLGQQSCSDPDTEQGSSLLQRHNSLTFTPIARHTPFGNSQLAHSVVGQIDQVARQDANDNINSHLELVAQASENKSVVFQLFELNGKFSAQRFGPHGLLFCRIHPCSLLLTHDDARRGIGTTAPLTEAGYQTVSKVKDDSEMKQFVVRVISKHDCAVQDEGGLMGLVPWFSGTTSVQSLDQLEDALLFELLSRGSHWIYYKNSAGITGDIASLDLNGYVVVACLKKDVEMKKFARRLCTSLGVKITDEAGFDGMIKYFSGSTGFQSFERLQSEIVSAAAAPHTWASSTLLQVNRGSTPAFVTEASQNAGRVYTSDRQLAQPIKEGANETDGQRILETSNVPTNGTQLLHDGSNQTFGGLAQHFGQFSLRRSSPNGVLFCTSHPCSLLLAELDARRGVGETAPLTEQGYQKVATIKDDYEMRKFIVRVITKYDCEVLKEGGLMGLVPWFSGTTSVQSLERLEDALLFELLSAGDHWMRFKNSAGVTGHTASLDLSGYVVVACLRRDEDMKKFTRRLCKQMGVKINDEGGLDGMITYFSGTNGFQSFERLQSEIQSAAAAPHTWASL